YRGVLRPDAPERRQDLTRPGFAEGLAVRRVLRERLAPPREQLDLAPRLALLRQRQGGQAPEGHVRLARHLARAGRALSQPRERQGGARLHLWILVAHDRETQRRRGLRALQVEQHLRRLAPDH